MNELMLHALAGMTEGNERDDGGYVVRHRRCAEDFGRSQDHKTAVFPNPLMAAYPLLWPYGLGGIECDRGLKVGFLEHVRWALDYYDRRFRLHHSFPFVTFGIHQKREALYSARLQMRRRDFDKEALALATLTVADLKEAEVEEVRKI